MRSTSNGKLVCTASMVEMLVTTPVPEPPTQIVGRTWTHERMKAQGLQSTSSTVWGIKKTDLMPSRTAKVRIFYSPPEIVRGHLKRAHILLTSQKIPQDR
ncbi:hypothetical protein PoB_006598100 [Plakobranchus ocellatus]|uniref:Uncharacterized protein n=1 Tax=Plakobranchus ocellatus TaxID=259542 RepID=A0AAV4D5N3_9GAST|nr:hypothetical protein PoB_006598100 [Plakobranchus ocellatus]